MFKHCWANYIIRVSHYFCLEYSHNQVDFSKYDAVTEHLTDRQTHTHRLLQLENC